MKISVIVTVYNLDKYIAESLQSVFDQTRKADEIIVVDDCSTDGTQEILNSLGDKIDYIRLKKNSGALLNTLSGVKKSSGDILCMLDGDDVWAKNKIEVVEKCFTENPELFLLSHHHIRVNEKLKELNIYDDTHQNIDRIREIAQNKFQESDLYKETILSQRGYWLGSAYSFRKSSFNIQRFEKIINSYENVYYTYLDLVIAPFLVLNNQNKLIGYTSETSFLYRVHNSSSMGAKNGVNSLLKANLRGKSTNELIYKIIQTCEGSQKFLTRRKLLIEYYDFLSALYLKQSRKAFKLFLKLSINLWNQQTTLKEFKRLVFISIFGVNTFLKAKK